MKRNSTLQTDQGQTIVLPQGLGIDWQTAACLLLLLGGLIRAHPATEVCGTISGQTWTKAGNPYLVTRDVAVNSLTISNGVLVIFQTNAVFRVNNRLLASGTEAEPIRFTSAGRTNCWQGIWFNQNPPGSVLEHCIIENSCNSGIRIYRAAPTIRYCTVENNSAPAYGGGILISNASIGGLTVTLDHCTVTKNTALYRGGGVAGWVETNRLNLVDCHLEENAVNPENVWNFSTYGGGLFVDGNAEVTQCRFVGNTCRASLNCNYCSVASVGGGVCAYNGSLTLNGCDLRRNSVFASHYAGHHAYAYGQGGGLYVAASAVRATNCIIAKNTSYGNYENTGSGAYFYSGDHCLGNCSVVENANTGLYCYSGSVVVTNTILYYNNNGGAQFTGNILMGYSCVEGGSPGEGNIFYDPGFSDPWCYCLDPYSPCVDAGHPSPEYSDRCFGDCLSLGTERNDMGITGGPEACNRSPCEPCFPLAVVVEPRGDVVAVGQSVEFSVVVSGSGPVGYQWYFNTNTPLPGPNEATLSLTNVQLSNAGTYHVVVANQCSRTNSIFVSLVVTPLHLAIDLYPGLSISNLVVGQTYEIQSTTDVTQTGGWTPRARFTNTSSQHLWFDPSPARHTNRFYYKVLPVQP